MNKGNQFDLHGFIVHFVFGAIVGAALGFIALLRINMGPSVTVGEACLMFMGLPAIVCGLAAGIAQDLSWDKFWDHTTDSMPLGRSGLDLTWLLLKYGWIALLIVWAACLLFFKIQE